MKLEGNDLACPHRITGASEELRTLVKKTLGDLELREGTNRNEGDNRNTES